MHLLHLLIITILHETNRSQCEYRHVDATEPILLYLNPNVLREAFELCFKHSSFYQTERPIRVDLCEPLTYHSMITVYVF